MILSRTGRAVTALAVAVGLIAAGIPGAASAVDTASPTAVAAPKADILDVDFRDGTPRDLAQGLAAKTWGAPTVATDATRVKNVATFDGTDDAYSYSFASEYSKLGTGLSIECSFRYDDDFPASGEARGNVCANKESGGFALTIYGKTLTFIAHIGGAYKSVGVDIDRDRWYHVVGAWDGQNIRLYLDGELAKETAAAGALRLPASGARNFFIGADSALSNGQQYNAPATVDVARVYSRGLSADEVGALADAAEPAPVLPKADILDVDFAGGAFTDHARGVAPIVSGAPAVSVDAAIEHDVARFDGSADALSYPINTEWSKLANSVSVECVFRYDGTLDTTERSVCANKETGGFAMVVYGKRLTFTDHVGGGYKNAAVDIEPGRWYHSVGVWNGSEVRLYVNGTLAASVPAVGAFKTPISNADNFVLGGDSSPNGGVQFRAQATLSTARVFSAALTDTDAAALYSASGVAQDKTIELTSTVPAAGDRLTGVTTFAATFADPSIVSSARYTLDGTEIALGDPIGAGLREGAHVIVVEANDVFGRQFTRRIEFTSANIPVGGGTDTGQSKGAVTLSANATNPSGGDVTTTFTEGLVTTASRGVQGVVNAVPTTLDFDYTGGSELTDPVIPGDDEVAASVATQQMPFQKFEIAAAPATGDDRHVIWTGSIDPSREARLYAWNVSTKRWVLLASGRGVTEGQLTLDAEVGSAFVDAARGVVHAMVLGVDPFADDLAEPVRDSFEDPADYDFSIAHFTDTQYLTEGAVERPTQAERDVWAKGYEETMRWIAANKDERKIAYAAHTGDIIEDWHNSSHVTEAGRANAQRQFAFASQAQSILESSGIPNGVLPGNHDNVSGADNGPDNLFNDYFAPERYEAQEKQQSWIDAQASYTPWREGDNSNSYQLFSAGGLDFVAVYLGFDVDTQEIAWANEVLAQYADRNAMIMTHAYNRPSSNPDGRGSSASHDGARVSEGIIKKNPNVFLVLSGHEHGVSIEVKRDVGQAGNNVVELLADYQFYKVGSDELGITGIGGYGKDTPLQFGSAFFRLLQFDVDRAEMSVDTYSPMLENFGATEYDDRNRYNGTEDDFRLPIQLETRKTSFQTDGLTLVTASDIVIGEATARSGWPASVTWSGLKAGQAYAWYATSRDAARGTELASGGVRQFAVFTATHRGTDVTPPVITLPEAATIAVGDAFDPLAGVSASDAVDGDVTANLQVVGSVDTATAGVYPLSYIARDMNGNQVIAARAVTVAAPAPTLPATVTAVPRTLAGKVHLGVTVQNEATVPVDITVETSYGSKTFTAVQPGKSVSVTLATRLASIPAGSVTAKVTGVVGGKTVTSTVAGEYAAFSTK